MELLYILLVLLVVTRGCAAAAVRFGQPALVGELIAGILLGMTANAFPRSLPVLSSLKDDDVFLAIADLGVFFLMLLGGLELRPNQLIKASLKSTVIAVLGMLIPFSCGFSFAWWILPESEYHFAQSIFAGTALSITAVPIAARVLMDFRKLDTPVGQIVIAAAVIDDILSLGLLAILTSLLDKGSWPGITGLGAIGLNIVIFFTLVSFIGLYLLPKIAKRIGRSNLEEFEFSFFLITAFGFGLLAENFHIHFILGAFAAGLFFTRSVTEGKVYDDVKSRVSGLTTGFLAPIFFASIGLHLELSLITEAPIFVLIFLLIAILAKFVGTGIPAYFLGFDRRESSIIGMSMSARGAVELVIADIALRKGLFDVPSPTPLLVEQLFSAVVVMAIVTTILTPIGLRFLLQED